MRTSWVNRAWLKRKAQVANLRQVGLSKMIGKIASSLPLRSNEDERGGLFENRNMDVNKQYVTIVFDCVCNLVG
ncbi:MAG: hypothetical protein A2W85_00330 [Bacteroidetes bacterium GWF2_41_31]|nr:MAG: hypothetical protein A2W85_00330 [Bacteroidetes bacterium GWF2_41_31]